MLLSRSVRTRTRKRHRMYTLMVQQPLHTTHFHTSECAPVCARVRSRSIDFTFPAEKKRCWWMECAFYCRFTIPEKILALSIVQHPRYRHHHLQLNRRILSVSRSIRVLFSLFYGIVDADKALGILIIINHRKNWSFPFLTHESCESGGDFVHHGEINMFFQSCQSTHSSGTMH